jgi:hypothetical protein
MIWNSREGSAEQDSAMSTDKKVKAEEFSVYAWYSTIPMTDDLYLGMQAQNIAVVDMMVIRQLENQALEEFFSDRDRVVFETSQLLSALSQMWVFALYEFLRTWRQRARTLLGFADKLATLKTDEERTAYMNEITEGVKAKGRFVKLAPVFYYEHVSKVGDKDFITAVRNYKDRTDALFRQVEAIRMPLAKHEIAGKEKLFAEAPGYGGISKLTGSMYWQIVLTDGTVDMIERRRLSDSFLGVMNPFEEQEQEEAKAKGASGDLDEEDQKWLDQMFGPTGPAKKQIAAIKRERRKKTPAAEANPPPEMPATKATRTEAAIAAKGEWPFKDALMVVTPESREERHKNRQEAKKIRRAVQRKK